MAPIIPLPPEPPPTSDLLAFSRDGLASRLEKETFPAIGAKRVKDLLQSIQARGVGDHAHDMR